MFQGHAYPFIARLLFQLRNAQRERQIFFLNYLYDRKSPRLHQSLGSKSISSVGFMESSQSTLRVSTNETKRFHYFSPFAVSSFHQSMYSLSVALIMSSPTPLNHHSSIALSSQSKNKLPDEEKYVYSFRQRFEKLTSDKGDYIFSPFFFFFIIIV